MFHGIDNNPYNILHIHIEYGNIDVDYLSVPRNIVMDLNNVMPLLVVIYS